MRYHIKERAWSLNGSFDVRDDGGNPIFDVRGKFLSAGDDMTLFDHRSGQKLVHIKQRPFAFRPTYNLYNGNEELWGSVTKGFSLFNERFTVKGSNGTLFTIKGKVLNWRFSISDERGQELGSVSNQQSLFRGSYAIDVAAGTDPSFIIALAVILERVKDKQKRAAAMGAIGR